MIVGNKFRKNRLSLICGGVTVRVIFHDWHVGAKNCDYINIKNADTYIRKVKRNKEVKEAYVI